MAGKNKQDIFSDACLGKKIPILTLDNKWYRLLDQVGREAVKELEDRLNALLKQQGKLNTQVKDIKRLKKKLMSEIVPMVDEMEQSKDKKLAKQIEEHKHLIAECNDKLESYREELIDLPGEIEKVNVQLMLLTMEYCYDTMQENTEQIEQLAEWVARIRVELKKNLIRKQEMEQKNYEIYSYMNDIFGADVINIFDMKYHPSGLNQATAPKTEAQTSEENR